MSSQELRLSSLNQFPEQYLSLMRVLRGLLGLLGTLAVLLVLRGLLEKTGLLGPLGRQEQPLLFRVLLEMMVIQFFMVQPLQPHKVITETFIFVPQPALSTDLRLVECGRRELL
jgi:hypothetical protein